MRRIAFYHFYDARPQVDEFVTHHLRALRGHAARIVVVANCALDPVSRERLAAVADDVWERDNIGFDVWAFKEGLAKLGAEALAEYDELLLTNCTFFGPLGSYEPLFAEMDADADLDFWGISEHDAVEPHPFIDGAPRMEAHLQSHWIAVRRRMFTSEAWRQFWDEMPMTPTYLEAVSHYEARLTHHFDQAGFRHRVAFPATDFPSQHPIMDTPGLMIDAGCPIVKRRALFREPLYTESLALDGRELRRKIERTGYPMDHLFANLARTTKPRDLVTNLGLLEILPDVDLGYDAERPLRVVALVHIFYPEMTDLLLDHLDTLPSGYDLVVTTPLEEARTEIEAVLKRRGVVAEVRLVDNQGRDMAALLVGCADIIESDDYDVIVRLHSKMSPQDAAGVGEMFRRHLLQNLLPGPGHAASLLKLFQESPTLGVVVPPVIHIGYPTLGHAWFTNRGPAAREARRLRIDVPFDDSTPVAAYGSMFVARPAALRPLLRGGYRYSDFPDNGGYADGALTHVLERLVCYGALSEGMHVHEVLSTELASLNYGYLEYKYQAVAAGMPGTAREQIDFLHRTQRRLARLRRVNRRLREAHGRTGAKKSASSSVVPVAPRRRPGPRATAGRLLRAPSQVARRLARQARESRS
ncbi:rhamnosyltransferase [Nocardioides terrae]|uniref:Rhamnosyltransferase n=1 Tax=Nocardioides terrae TaxID=574651 RepID=A0A1I1IZA6_9ACTN|nr:rhamnan synthesis F family protein [Nocardioides terrae]SFC38550.1 rhamnosyltransferase [Nocardioides terrae]